MIEFLAWAALTFMGAWIAILLGHTILWAIKR